MEEGQIPQEYTEQLQELQNQPQNNIIPLEPVNEQNNVNTNPQLESPQEGQIGTVETQPIIEAVSAESNTQESPNTPNKVTLKNLGEVEIISTNENTVIVRNKKGTIIPIGKKAFDNLKANDARLAVKQIFPMLANKQLYEMDKGEYYTYLAQGEGVNTVIDYEKVEQINNNYDKIVNDITRNVYKKYGLEYHEGYLVESTDTHKAARQEIEKLLDPIVKKRSKEMKKIIDEGLLKNHKQIVNNALDLGLDVPEKILKMYPYLSAKSKRMNKGAVNNGSQVSNTGRKVDTDINAGRSEQQGTIHNTQQTSTERQQIETPTTETTQTTEQPTEQTMPIDNRHADTVGNRKVNAYQYDNPEVKPFYQGAARYILDNEFVPNAQFDETTKVMEMIKDETGLTPKQVKDGLERIINDEGAENRANAKKD